MSDPNAKTSPYDVETVEEDLWFSPAPPEDLAPTAPPWPLAEPRATTTAQDWHKAEAGLGRALAEAAAALARLDQAMAKHEGALARLAASEIAGLSWAEGQRLTPERIALYGAARLSATSADHRDLARAEWARSRLLSGTNPLVPEDFLGRGRVDTDGLGEVGTAPTGEEFRALALRWQSQVANADLHPISRAAFAFHLWRTLGLCDHEAVIEPALLAGAIGAEGLHNLPFLPLANAGLRGLVVSGSPETRLAGFLHLAAGASRAGLLELNRLLAWQDRAREKIAGLSGRTPGRLIDALGAVGVLSAMQAEALTGASRAAVSRNLDRLVSMGLAREITGQSRYRFWRAAL